MRNTPAFPLLLGVTWWLPRPGEAVLCTETLFLPTDDLKLGVALVESG